MGSDSRVCAEADCREENSKLTLPVMYVFLLPLYNYNGASHREGKATISKHGLWTTSYHLSTWWIVSDQRPGFRKKAEEVHSGIESWGSWSLYWPSAIQEYAPTVPHSSVICWSKEGGVGLLQIIYIFGADISKSIGNSLYSFPQYDKDALLCTPWLQSTLR